MSGSSCPFCWHSAWPSSCPCSCVALGWLGLVSSFFLRTYRRHAIVVVLILAAVLTPGPDIFSQLIMGIPLVILYEGCVWIIWAMERTRRRGAQRNF